MYVPHKKGTYPKFSATSDVRYCVVKPIVRCSAGAAWRGDRYIERKQAELETENK